MPGAKLDGADSMSLFSGLFCACAKWQMGWPRLQTSIFLSHKKVCFASLFISF